MGGGGGGGGGGKGPVSADGLRYSGCVDWVREVGSAKISTVGGRTLCAERASGRMECWVGVKGEESTTEAGEISELLGEGSRWCLRVVVGSGARVVASDSVDCVTCELCLELTLRGERVPCSVDVLPDRDDTLIFRVLSAFTVLG